MNINDIEYEYDRTWIEYDCTLCKNCKIKTF